MELIGAKQAKEKSNHIKTQRMVKFTQMMQSTATIAGFNYTIEKAIKEGHTCIEIDIPQEGYEEEAKGYFTQFGYTTNSSSKPGKIYISW